MSQLEDPTSHCRGKTELYPGNFGLTFINGASKGCKVVPTNKGTVLIKIF